MPKRLIALFLLLAFLLSACTTTIPKTRLARLGEAHIAYRSNGKGEPLVMVTGFGATMDIWSPVLLQELARDYQVVVFDLSGVAESASGSQAVSIQEMADDCMAFIRQLGLKKPHVLGWSMGGLVAQEMVLNNPLDTGKLILLGTACDAEPVAAITDKLTTMSEAELLSHFFPPAWLSIHPDAFDTLPRPRIPASPEAIEAQARAMRNWEGTCGRLKHLDKHTLILTGNQDDILPPELSLKLVERIRGSWLVRFDNARHWLQYQRPQRLAAVIRFFLKTETDMIMQQKTPAR